MSNVSAKFLIIYQLLYAKIIKEDTKRMPQLINEYQRLLKKIKRHIYYNYKEIRIGEGLPI